MFRQPIFVLGLVLSALMMQTVVAAEPLSPAIQWIPQNAVFALEVSDPEALLDLACSPKVTAVVTSSPLYKQQASQPGFQQFQQVIEFLETSLNTDWETGLSKLLGGGVTLAVCPDETILLIVDSEDAQMLAQLHEIFLNIAKSEAEKRGRPEEVASGEYHGHTGWTFNKDEAHVILGNRLLVSNRPEALKAALDLRADPNRPSLATLPAYQAAKKAVGPDAAASAFVNLGDIMQHPPARSALEASNNPLAALLFADVMEAVRESSWLALGLKVEGETLSLEAAVDGKATDPSGPATFTWSSQPGESAMPNLSVPRRIAGLSFYRDLHGFYAAKDELFPERTSGLIFFENMMGIFFSGLDLTEEVLSETEPQVRFVVAEQEYDADVGTPQLQVPAFAAIFRLSNPDKFAVVMEEAWQKALGLINFTRGQQALPGLIIDRHVHADTKFSLAYFATSKEDEGKQLHSRYNFRPALAVVDDSLILSSTDSLAKDLIDALKKEKSDAVKPLGEVHSFVEVDGVQLASILDANRENLIRQNMVGEGSTRQQAEIQMDLLTTVIKYLGQTKLEMGNHQGQPRASIQLKLNLP